MNDFVPSPALAARLRKFALWVNSHVPAERDEVLRIATKTLSEDELRMLLLMLKSLEEGR